MAQKNKNSRRNMERRNFLKGGVLAGAAAFVAPAAAAAPQTAGPSAEAEVLTTDSCGSDYMVDVIKSLGFEYVCANPGSSFRGMQESILNYGGNRNPAWLDCRRMGTSNSRERLIDAASNRLLTLTAG